MSRLEFDCVVPVDHPCLPGHFPGRPIVPGVLLLDQVLSALQQATHRRIARLQRVKFAAALLPDESAIARCEIEGLQVSFRVCAQRDNVEVVLASGSALLLAVGRVT
jgi:3-hydroxymyristoyl/3-hydroxydecanoyl-(acyl carrier protein) dehydratase